MPNRQQNSSSDSLIQKLSIEQPHLYLNSQGLFMLDSDLKVVYWSRNMEILTGIQEHEILQEDLFKSKFSHFISRREFFEEVQKSQSSLFYNHKDEITNHWFSISLFPLKGSLLVTLKDITEEKAQQMELRTIKNLKSHVLNSTPDIIWAIDKKYNLLLGNNSYFKIMKKNTGKEINPGDNVLEEQIEEHRKLRGTRSIMWKELYNKALEGNHETTTFSIPENENSSTVHEVTVQPIISEEPENISGVACFARDVTEKYEHIKSIEKQNKRLKQIAWLQSHKVRAPLANILGLTDIILTSKDPEKSEELLPLLQKSANDLDEVIKEISRETRND